MFYTQYSHYKFDFLLTEYAFCAQSRFFCVLIQKKMDREMSPHATLKNTGLLGANLKEQSKTNSSETYFLVRIIKRSNKK